MDIMIVDNVKGYIDENGTAWLDAEAVARGWGFTTVATSGNEVVRWARVNEYLKGFGFIPTSGDGIKQGDFLPENMVYRLGFKANNQKAQAFQAKLADEIIPSIRKTGSYSLTTHSYMIEDPIKRAERWIEEYKERKQLEESNQLLLFENTKLNESLSIAKPKADYTDLVLQSKNAIPITVIAKDYGMSARKMNTLLKELEIQYCVSGTWLLYAKHQGKGYTKTVTIPYNDGKNSAVYMKWTQKGRLFLYYELKNIGVLPNIEK